MATTQPTLASYNNHNHNPKHSNTNSNIHNTQLFKQNHITSHTNESVVERKILSNLANNCQYPLLANPRKRSTIEPPEHLPKLWLSMDEDTTKSKRLKPLEKTGSGATQAKETFKYNPWSVLSYLKFPTLRPLSAMISGSHLANNTSAPKFKSQQILNSEKDPLTINNNSERLIIDKSRLTKPWAPSNLRPLRDDISTTTTSTLLKDVPTPDTPKAMANKTPINHFLLKKSQEDRYSKYLEKSFQTKPQKVNLLPKDTLLGRLNSSSQSLSTMTPEECLPRLSSNLLIDSLFGFKNNSNNNSNSVIINKIDGENMPSRRDLTQRTTQINHNSLNYNKLYSTGVSGNIINSNRSAAHNYQPKSMLVMNSTNSTTLPYKVILLHILNKYIRARE